MTTKLSQPVNVIRHDDPGKGCSQAFPIHRSEELHGKVGIGRTIEDAMAVPAHHGDAVDVARDGSPAGKQLRAGHEFENARPHGFPASVPCQCQNQGSSR
ncbi:hypothetical protein BN126330138 [Stenotrophomonas thermophila]|nr:hypothetical protein BN126330138 [Stenotrophomonas maltophilia]